MTMQTEIQPQVTPERIRQFAFSYAPALLLETAVEHGVFDALHAAPKTLEEVVQKTHTSHRGLRALMNALVGLQLLAKTPRGEYTLTPESAMFLVSSSPAYSGGFFRHIRSRHLPGWLNLSETVRTGKPLQAVNTEEQGTEFFEDFVEDLFPVNYQAARTLGSALRISEAERPVSVLDLAAGSGVWGIALAQQSPQVDVTAVDWASVLPVTRRMAARFGLAERFRYVPGDLLEADFGRGHHVATLGHILHSMGREDSRALLQKTYGALAPGGTIAIAEWLVNEERTQPAAGLIFAVTMLVNTEYGDTYSAEEICGWLHEAGFANCRMLDNPGLSPLILATRPTASL